MFWTVARIAEHFSVPRHRVEYVIETRRIRPAGRAGIARVFNEHEVESIGSHLRRIDAEREEVRCGE